MAHVRRDFIDIQKKFPDNQYLCKWAEEWIVKIAELYSINKERVKYPKENKFFLEYDTRLKNALEKIKGEFEKLYDNEVQTATMKSMNNDIYVYMNGPAEFITTPGTLAEYEGHEKAGEITRYSLFAVITTNHLRKAISNSAVF